MPARRTRGGGGGKSQDVYGFINALHPENAAVNLPSQDKLTAAKAAKFFGRLGFLTIKDLPKDGWRFAKRFVLHHSFSLSPHSHSLLLAVRMSLRESSDGRPPKGLISSH